MTGNYERVKGGSMAIWEDESTESAADGPVEIEEMYVDNGDLVIRFEFAHDGHFYDLQIPIKAKQSWNEFVGDLPTWDV